LQKRGRKMDKNSEEKITVELNVNEFKKLQKLLELDEKNEQDQQKKESEKKNLNFIQLYRENMPELRWLMANHNFASSLLFFIIEHMDNKNALACSYSIFEDYFGKSKMTIYRGIKVLEENGFLSVLKMGTSNVYLVNEDLAWTNSNDKKKFAKYDGKILISKKENKDYVYRKQFDRFKSLREREGLK
jgi:hypothetical protein